MACPRHLDSSCASSVAVHSGAKKTQEVYKGCSAFEFAEKSNCFNFEVDGGDEESGDFVSVCKETCSGN